MKKIYLDSAATTKVSESVIKEMGKIYSEIYGNPSSLHEFGERAQKEMNKAREEISKYLECKAWEIVFTSGATESNNLAIKGLTEASPSKKKIIVSPIEHPSIVEVCNYLKKKGYEIVEIGVNKEGKIDPARLEKELDKDTKNILLVSVMHANNEIGVIQDISVIGSLCRNRNIPFHTDAVQSFGKLDIDVKKMNVSLLSASAHKFGGPKGVGLLYVNEGVRLGPIIHGGGQEKDLRSGTENVPGIIGFAKSLGAIRKVNKKNIEKLRDRLISGLEKIGGKINGSKKDRLYNNVHVSFPDAEGESMVLFLSQKGIMCSTGSACSTKKQAESKTLRALGLNSKEIAGSLRFTLSEDITEGDIDRVVRETEKVYKQLKI